MLRRLLWSINPELTRDSDLPAGPRLGYPPPTTNGMEAPRMVLTEAAGGG